GLRTRKDANEALEGELVAVGTETRHAADARRSHPRPAPEGLARVGVRQVDLDARQRDGTQRVVNGDGGVRVRGGIEQEASEPFRARLADPVDDGSLVVALSSLDARPQRAAAGL